ncbi:peptidoglycan DD-metalloendopeptidase family protein [Paucibacter sp. JuS9]|uniref:peptidoglycan DD-metalloendopeptidase family protein n=1 Tax=Paucibacter sp. JuS9 TaxID=3228748 RepID=UPI0037563746
MHLKTKRLNPALSALLASGIALLAGCSTTAHRAPVEDRPVSQATPAPSAVTASAPSHAASAPEAPKPGAENAGKPGYYTVKPGDALIRIALDTGQNWRDLARWNGLENPNRIEVGQVLRVVPPGADPAPPGAASTRPIASARVETRPLDGKPAPAGTAPQTAEPAASAASALAGAAAATEDELSWGWPAAGSVISQFDDLRNKGLDIGGKAGDPVYAAADGRVMYAGSGARGYGNMIIIKHVNNYLSAYGHNQALLVKEDQVVRKGQRIAEMGNSDSDQVKLHFELRKQGKPIDPAKLLPAR